MVVLRSVVADIQLSPLQAGCQSYRQYIKYQITIDFSSIDDRHAVHVQPPLDISVMEDNKYDAYTDLW